MSRMPTFGEVSRDAVGGRAFANGGEGDAWQAGWCLREGAPCRHDDMDRGGNTSCSLLEVALLTAKTPRQWVDRTPVLGPGMYRCTMYEADQEV